MLAMEPDEQLGTDEIHDAMREVANMVMGSVKSRIMETVGDIQVSIPSVVSGAKLENSLGEGSEEISINVNLDEEVARLSLLYRDAAQPD